VSSPPCSIIFFFLRTHLALVPTHGAPYPWYIDPLPVVFWPPYPWYFDPLPMVHRPPIHGILTPYPWYFDPQPIPWLEMRGVKIPWGFNLPYRGVNIPWGQNTIWHLSFLHSWPITGFVIRLTWRVPLAEQEQLTFPRAPKFSPGF
jgi:hypothetical protein